MGFFSIINFISIVIYLLWFAAIFDPIGNLYGIRFIALFLCALSLFILLAMNKINTYKYNIQTIFLIVYSFLMPIYGLIIYIFRSGSLNFTDTSYIASGFLMLTSLLYFNKELCDFGIKSFIFSLRLLSFLIIIIALTEFFSFGNDWFSLFTESNVALISHRNYGSIRFPYIYFLASPMLIYLIGHDLYNFIINKNLINTFLFLISLISFILTGTRAHIIIGILYIPIFLLIINFRKYSIYSGFIIILFLIISLIYGDVYLVASEFFSTSEASNTIKLNMLSIYGDIFSDPISLIFGHGYNAHEWSIPLRGIIALDEGATKTELTYLEIFRVFGIFVGSIIILSLIYLLSQSSLINSKMKWLYPSLSIYLVNAALNPYLFSTNGILPIALIIAILKLKKL